MPAKEEKVQFPWPGKPGPLESSHGKLGLSFPQIDYLGPILSCRHKPWGGYILTLLDPQSCSSTWSQAMEEGDTAPQSWVPMACLTLWRPTEQELGAGFLLWLPMVYLGLGRLVVEVGGGEGSGSPDWFRELLLGTG